MRSSYGERVALAVIQKVSNKGRAMQTSDTDQGCATVQWQFG